MERTHSYRHAGLEYRIRSAEIPARHCYVYPNRNHSGKHRRPVEYVPFELGNDLSETFDAIFYLNGYAPEHTVERLVPDGRVALVVALDENPRYVYDNHTREVSQEYRGAWISGVHSSYLTIGLPAVSTLVAAQFRIGTAHAYLHVSLDQLRDSVVDAATVVGEPMWAVRRRLKQLESPTAKLKELANWMIERRDDARLTPPAVAAAVARILESPNVATVRDILRDSGYTRKHMNTLFRRYVGTTPKSLQRIIRFAETLKSIQQSQRINWAQLSADCGYYDQSHFIKDFQDFSGFRPQQFVDLGFDRQNFFPDG